MLLVQITRVAATTATPTTAPAIMIGEKLFLGVSVGFGVMGGSDEMVPGKNSGADPTSLVLIKQTRSSPSDDTGTGNSVSANIAYPPSDA